MTAHSMRRRSFLTLLGGAAAAWPMVARAQQARGVPAVGVLMGYAENDAEGQSNVAAFRLGLRQLGWIEGRTIHLEERFALTNTDRARLFAAELVKMSPKVILVNGPGMLIAVRRESGSIPIVFAEISDPIGLGFVESLARPGRNTTGFTLFEVSIVPKLLEALKEIAPRIERVACFVNAGEVAGHLRHFEAAAPSFGVTAVSAPVNDAAEIEQAIELFARKPNGGLLFPPQTITSAHRELIVALASHYHLPAVYSARSWVLAGGLMYYGIASPVDQFRRAASYVDRILRGEKASDLPVQQPTKFEFGLNLKTAKALNLEVPTSILLRATEVIE